MFLPLMITDMYSQVTTAQELCALHIAFARFLLSMETCRLKKVYLKNCALYLKAFIPAYGHVSSKQHYVTTVLKTYAGFLPNMATCV